MTTNIQRRPFRFIYKLLIGILMLVGMLVIAMIFGAASITLHDVWLALTSNATSEKITIIREIRLPREIAAIFVGAALAVS